MDYKSISIIPYIKSHLELQRKITLIELAPSPYFFISSIRLVYMNKFAKRRMDNLKTVYPPQTKFAGGINITYK